MKKHYNLFLITSILLTGFLAVNAHALILQYFIPPHIHMNSKIIHLFPYIASLMMVTGAIIIYSLSKTFWNSLNIFNKIILFTLLLLALTEQLFRLPFMTMWVGMPWEFQVLYAIPVYLGFLVLSFLIFFGMPIISRINNFIFLKYIIFVTVTTGIVFFIKIIVSHMLLPLYKYVPQVNQSSGIFPPYGMSVMIPAYITYLEPTIACFILFSLIKDKLSAVSTLKKGFIIGGILILLHGGHNTIVQVMSSQGNIFYRIFYYGQYLWEYLTLGILTVYSSAFLEKIRQEPAINFANESSEGKT